jgi:light-regulated signal transduction histidine kinase (bacteriophytochrome)
VFDVGQACLSIVEVLRKRDPVRRVELELEPGMRLQADPELMTTALTAMIDNAWKFTSRKEQGWIKVGLALSKNADEKVLFVSDNGAGYDPAYASKLFTAFQRLHSSADFPGAGLGLVMVQRVALRHGGQVWSESTGTSGATFYLSLPQENARPRSAAREARADATTAAPFVPGAQAAAKR